MALPRIDYTSKSYESIRDSLIDYLQVNYAGLWTDFNSDTLGTALIDLLSYVGAVLAYNLDFFANEAFIDRARLRKNVISLCKLISYELSSGVAATTTCRFTLTDAPLASHVLVPINFRISTKGQDPVFFETTESGVILGGESYIDIACQEGKTLRDQFANATGTANQRYALRFSPLIDGTQTIWTDDGVSSTEWTEVKSFLESLPTDKHYIVETDEDGISWITFGDGATGAKPNDGDTIYGIYRVGGGIRGNVEVDTLVNLEGVLKDVNDNAVNASVTNLEAAAGGEDAESIETARSQAPKQLRTSFRSITNEDFETNAIQVPGIVRALALSHNEDDTLSENECYLYLVPTGGGDVSETVMDAVETWFEEERPYPITLVVHYFIANYVPVDISIDVWRRTGFTLPITTSDIQDALEVFFDYEGLNGKGEPNIDFGRDIHISELYNILQDLDCVDHVIITIPTGDVTVGNTYIAALGTVSITDRGSE